MFFMYCVCYAFVRVCFLVITCWERADLFGSRLWCPTVSLFPIGILGQMWYLIVSVPDLCTLTYSDHKLGLLAPPDSSMNRPIDKSV